MDLLSFWWKALFNCDLREVGGGGRWGQMDWLPAGRLVLVSRLAGAIFCFGFNFTDAEASKVEIGKACGNWNATQEWNKTKWRLHLEYSWKLACLIGYRQIARLEIGFIHSLCSYFILTGAVNPSFRILNQFNNKPSERVVFPPTQIQPSKQFWTTKLQTEQKVRATDLWPPFSRKSVTIYTPKNSSTFPVTPNDYKIKYLNHLPARSHLANQMMFMLVQIVYLTSFGLMVITRKIFANKKRTHPNATHTGGGGGAVFAIEYIWTGWVLGCWGWERIDYIRLGVCYEKLFKFSPTQWICTWLARMKMTVNALRSPSSNIMR